MEGTARVQHKSDLHNLFAAKEFSSVKHKEEIRELRNNLVHYPWDYAKLYRDLNKYKTDLLNALYICCAMSKRYDDKKIDYYVKVLLKFYKSAKEEM